MSCYATSRPGQLNLLPLAGWKVSMGQSAVMFCSLEIKASKAHFACGLSLWVAIKTAMCYA